MFNLINASLYLVNIFIGIPNPPDMGGIIAVGIGIFFITCIANLVDLIIPLNLFAVLRKLFTLFSNAFITFKRLFLWVIILLISELSGHWFENLLNISRTLPCTCVVSFPWIEPTCRAMIPDIEGILAIIL